MVKKGQVPVILKWGIGAIEGAIEEDIERTYGGWIMREMEGEF